MAWGLGSKDESLLLRLRQRPRADHVGAWKVPRRSSRGRWGQLWHKQRQGNLRSAASRKTVHSRQRFGTACLVKRLWSRKELF